MSEPAGIRSHWRPRTGRGRIAIGGFLFAMALAQPPVVWLVANRVEPLVGGIPFLYVWLAAAYAAMAAMLLWAWQRGV